MKNWILNNWLVITGVLLGALGGYLYWQQIGCSSGTCRITSQWQNSTGYGALMGGLFFSLFRREKKSEKNSGEVK